MNVTPINPVDLLWMACVHILDGTAREITCRPERIAVCTACVLRGPEAAPTEDFRMTCPACLGEWLECRPVLVRGRKHLEQDRVLGHVHGECN
jgi:hypothetical protein